MNINSKYLGGFVFKGKNDFLFRDLFMQISQNDFRISIKEGTINNKEWTIGTIKSNIAFKKEETSPPYEYHFYFIEKRGASLSIVLSENKELATKLLNEMQKLNRAIFPIRINTEIILNNIDTYTFARETGRENKFIVNYLFAKIEGMQDKLTSITLYGKDVLKSVLYLNYKDNFNSLTCGLAIEEGAFNFSEISRVSNDGYISFYVNDNVFDNVQLITTFLHNTKSFIL